MKIKWLKSILTLSEVEIPLNESAHLHSTNIGGHKIYLQFQ